MKKQRTRKQKIKRALFYLRRELIRWAVMLVGDLAVLCMLVYMLEDADGRMFFYGIAGFFAALLIGSLFYGKEDRSDKR